MGPVRDRKAFRLCIAEEDCTRLLDASKWPDSIVISEWFYVSPDNYQGLRSQDIVNEDGGQTLNMGEVQMQESHSDIQDTSLMYYDDGTTSALSRYFITRRTRRLLAIHLLTEIMRLIVLLA